jgi:hypothetical protein
MPRTTIIVIAAVVAEADVATTAGAALAEEAAVAANATNVVGVASPAVAKTAVMAAIVALVPIAAEIARGATVVKATGAAVETVPDGAVIAVAEAETASIVPAKIIPPSAWSLRSNLPGPPSRD